MTTFDLETTYIALDAGRVTELPGGSAFWEDPARLAHAAGRLITVGAGEGDWPHWEMHPHGDEVLIVLEGEVRMVFEQPGGEQSFYLKPGSTLVVPSGVWHRAVGQKHLRLMFMTYGKGTTHKPL